jgi:hypothetical protein
VLFSFPSAASICELRLQKLIYCLHNNVLQTIPLYNHNKTWARGDTLSDAFTRGKVVSKRGATNHIMLQNKAYFGFQKLIHTKHSRGISNALYCIQIDTYKTSESNPLREKYFTQSNVRIGHHIYYCSVIVLYTKQTVHTVLYLSASAKG